MQLGATPSGTSLEVPFYLLSRKRVIQFCLSAVPCEAQHSRTMGWCPEAVVSHWLWITSHQEQLVLGQKPQWKQEVWRGSC